MFNHRKAAEEPLPQRKHVSLQDTERLFISQSAILDSGEHVGQDVIREFRTRRHTEGEALRRPSLSRAQRQVFEKVGGGVDVDAHHGEAQSASSSSSRKESSKGGSTKEIFGSVSCTRCYLWVGSKVERVSSFSLLVTLPSV